MQKPEATSGSPANFDGLIERTQSLPPELFNNFRDMVFSVEPSTKVIARTTRPPVQLAVDRATRAAFAKDYFGNGSRSRFEPGARRVLRRWLVSLAKEHLALIESRCLLYLTADAYASEGLPGLRFKKVFLRYFTGD